MRFGFALPGRGPLARPDVLVKLAEKADALRYSSIFVTDHVVLPSTYTSIYPYSPSGKAAADWNQGYLEPLALMSFSPAPRRASASAPACSSSRIAIRS